MDIGKRINILLLENNMEQKDLAEALYFTQASMSRWIKGSRIPKSDALCAIADYFDVTVDWLLGRSERRNYNGFISGDEALEYCEKAKELAWECWRASAKFDATEMPASRIADNMQACAYFEREILRWEYDIPRMIHSLVDGTWRNVTEPQTCEECEHWNDTEDGCADRHGCKIEPQSDCEDVWRAGYKTGYDKGFRDAQKVNDSRELVKDLVDDEFNPYDEECMRCKHLKLKCEFIPTYCKFESRDEPQTDCDTCRHYKLACELFSEVCKYEPTTQNSNLTFEKVREREDE